MQRAVADDGQEIAHDLALLRICRLPSCIVNESFKIVIMGCLRAAGHLQSELSAEPDSTSVQWVLQSNQVHPSRHKLPSNETCIAQSSLSPCFII